MEITIPSHEIKDLNKLIEGWDLKNIEGVKIVKFKRNNLWVGKILTQTRIRFTNIDGKIILKAYSDGTPLSIVLAIFLTVLYVLPGVVFGIVVYLYGIEFGKTVLNFISQREGLEDMVSHRALRPLPDSKFYSPEEIPPPPSLPSGDVKVASKINYEKAKVIYKVKVENNTPNPISDIRIHPFVSSEIFIIDQMEKQLSLLKPHESTTVTFTLRPKGECGNVDINCMVTHYDIGDRKYKKIELEPKTTNIICPMLTLKEIDEDVWRTVVGTRLIRAEEITEEIPMSAENLFKITCDSIRDLNLFMLPIDKSQDDRLFRGIARFYGEGRVKGLSYAAQIEVIGGESKSKMILKTYANREDSLIGFHHCILDEIEKRNDLKKYISDGIIVKGDYVVGDKKEFTDTVIHKSNV